MWKIRTQFRISFAILQQLHAYAYTHAIIKSTTQDSLNKSVVVMIENTNLLIYM